MAGGTRLVQAVGVESPVPGLGDPVVGKDLPGRQLVHCQRRTQYPAADVRHVGQLEEALQGSVLPEGAMDEGEYCDRSVGGQLREAGEGIPGWSGRIEAVSKAFHPAVGEGRCGIRGQRPASIPADADGDHLVAPGVHRCQHVSGRHA